MFKLPQRQNQPYELVLLTEPVDPKKPRGKRRPAVTITVRPIALAGIIIAREAASQAQVALLAGNDDEATNGDLIGVANVAFTKALARWAINAWDGIGDNDGNAIEPTPDNIDAALDVFPIYQAFDNLYSTPALLGLDEKNASAPSPDGNTGAKTADGTSAATAKSSAETALTG
jgi:hypothetical protein